MVGIPSVQLARVGAPKTEVVRGVRRTKNASILELVLIVLPSGYAVKDVRSGEEATVMKIRGCGEVEKRREGL